MTKFHLFSQDSVRLETAPTGECVSPINYMSRMNVQKFQEFHSIANDFLPFLCRWFPQLNPDLKKKLDFLGVYLPWCLIRRMECHSEVPWLCIPHAND